MNAPQKIVPRSKLSEWRGLDRIALVVHGMQCIWREQEKDDIGIDGEIELCRPRVDGDGLIGTGKIVKVQSKSGSSYVIKDQDDSFASPVTEKDLRYWRDLNVPVIYVVYHPDDGILYWKDVKAYLVEHPDALTAPFRIAFDKATDRFDESAYPALCALCEQAPERVATDAGEALYTNLLPVIELPKRIWVTAVLPEKQPHFHDRLTGAGIIPPFVYKAGMLVTLTDPALPGTALTPVIDDGTQEDFSLDDWLGQAEENEHDLRALLNSVLHRHLRRLGMEFQKEPRRRYFFNKGLAEDSPLHRSWRSARTGKNPSRLVAKHYTYGKLSFFRHLALNARVQRFGLQWAIGIYPALHFSTDGTRPWTGEAARSYAIRARAEEYNNVYLNNVLFWASQLSGGQEAFTLHVGDEPVVTISGVPLIAEAGFSIRTAGPTERRRS
jgi:Domain of unknown function (DUF4365)